MSSIDKINDQELETVAGGTITQEEALAKALEKTASSMSSTSTRATAMYSSTRRNGTD